jgi:hypothetical protein
MPPNITFRVVDKATGKDLFFGSTAQYATSQLKVHHILNGHIDTFNGTVIYTQKQGPAVVAVLAK